MSSGAHFKADLSPITKGNKVIFCPRALDIIWGNDKRYWNISPKDTKNEDSVAELKQVCWLEVTGSIEEKVVRGKSYKVGFQVSLRSDAFGWDDCEVSIMAKIGKKGEFIAQKVNLDEQPSSDKKFIIPKDGLIIQVDPEKESSNDDGKLYFGLYEVWSDLWKGGLKIHHAFVETLLE